MNGVRTAAEVLDRDFLETRGKLLELAASLDRLDRAATADGRRGDPRLEQLARALVELRTEGPGRAERIQLIFSDDFDPKWLEHSPPSPRR